MRKNAVLMTVLMVALVFALMPVAMPAVGAGVVACDWTGTWDTCWGKMELVQTGSVHAQEGGEVTGTAYLPLPLPNRTGSYKSEVDITGFVLCKGLLGYWRSIPLGRSGNMQFTISDDCSSFEGTWQCGHGLKEVWTGSRVGPSKQPSTQPSKQSVCASAKISIAGASKFERAWFTIGGTEPQKVRITQPAENFAIVNEGGGKYGGVVYQVIERESWGSLTLEPGTYRLSCSGGGAINLMSATVCIEYVGAKEVPTSGNQTVSPKPEEKEKPPMEEVKPSLPRGPIEKIIIRPSDNLEAIELVMEIEKEKRFVAWGEDAAGHKKSVTVKEWKVSDENIGSIDKDGLFKAGPKEGKVKIRATVKNQEGNDITGVFRIEVTAVPPITFTGKVELYDENNKLLYPGGVEVELFAKSYKNRGDLNHGSYFDQRDYVKEFKFEAKTDKGGLFKFVVPAEVDNFFLASWYWKLQYIPTTPHGYEWCPIEKPLDQPDSDEAVYNDPVVKPERDIRIAPEGFPCFQLWLEKTPTYIFIDGKVTHHGKPVKNATVRLFDNGKLVNEDRSDCDGYFMLYVDNLPKGSYRLTAKFKPTKYDVAHATVHNYWLYIKKDIPVDLPLPTDTKTINIELISFAEKIGYTGP